MPWGGNSKGAECRQVATYIDKRMPEAAGSCELDKKRKAKDWPKLVRKAKEKALHKLEVQFIGGPPLAWHTHLAHMGNN